MPNENFVTRYVSEIGLPIVFKGRAWQESITQSFEANLEICRQAGRVDPKLGRFISTSFHKICGHADLGVNLINIHLQSIIASRIENIEQEKLDHLKRLIAEATEVVEAIEKLQEETTKGSVWGRKSKETRH